MLVRYRRSRRGPRGPAATVAPCVPRELPSATPGPGHEPRQEPRDRLPGDSSGAPLRRQVTERPVGLTRPPQARCLVAGDVSLTPRPARRAGLRDPPRLPRLTRFLRAASPRCRCVSARVVGTTRLAGAAGRRSSQGTASGPAHSGQAPRRAGAAPQSSLAHMDRTPGQPRPRQRNLLCGPNVTVKRKLIVHTTSLTHLEFSRARKTGAAEEAAPRFLSRPRAPPAFVRVAQRPCLLSLAAPPTK